jgi:hypothetical protein
MSPLYRHAKRFRKLLAAFLSILASQYAYAKQIDIESMLRKSEVEQRPIPLVVPMGDHFNVSATAEATKEGNGTLTIGNLTLRLQDHHDDGLVYGSKGYLRLDVERLGVGSQKSNPSALIVSGILTRSGEKESDPVSNEAITVIYILDCQSKTFKRVFSTTSYEIDLGIARGKRIACPKQ